LLKSIEPEKAPIVMPVRSPAAYSSDRTRRSAVLPSGGPGFALAAAAR